MQVKPKSQVYREFLEFIERHAQKERQTTHKRMFWVFFWCFFMPAASAAMVLMLIKGGLAPLRFRAHLDGLLLVYPVGYSLYILSAEVLKDLPGAFRRGGIAGLLHQSRITAEWRHEVCSQYRFALGENSQNWQWIVSNFRLDLRALRDRTRYITALGGAVFFLMIQGIDTVTEPSLLSAGSPVAFLQWIESSSGRLTQLTGLGLFLALLYLSGMQSCNFLERYLQCAELMTRPDLKEDEDSVDRLAPLSSSRPFK